MNSETKSAEDNEERPIAELELPNDSFMFALNTKENNRLSDIVKARANTMDLNKMFPGTDNEQLRVLALYCHSSYELGVLRGQLDADRIMDQIFKERDIKNGNSGDDSKAQAEEAGN